MIRTETVQLRGKPYIHTYSDGFYYIESSTGTRHVDAYDPIDAPKSYAETTISIEPTAEDLDDALAVLGRILAEAG